MKFLIVLLVQIANAQAHTGEIVAPDLSMLRQEGQLLTVRITIGEPLRIYVVGREEAKLDLSDLKLTVRRTDPYPTHELQVTKQGEFFTVPQALTGIESTAIEVKTQVKNKVETFHFKLENRPH